VTTSYCDIKNPVPIWVAMNSWLAYNAWTTPMQLSGYLLVQSMHAGVLRSIYLPFISVRSASLP